MKSRLIPEFEKNVSRALSDIAHGKVYSPSMQRLIWFSNHTSRREMGFIFGG